MRRVTDAVSDEALAAAMVALLLVSFVVSGAGVRIWWAATVIILVVLVALAVYAFGRRPSDPRRDH